jgi:ubiquinone/menaquinone biosynthesis C-methylase UbiE
MDRSPWSKLKSEIYALIGRNPKSNRVIGSVADLGPDQVVLDVGCGPGVAVRAAAGSVARAVGVDRSEAMVDIARRRSQGISNVEFAVGAAESLPFPDADFDRVWTIHAFHHWEDPARGIAEVLRVLRPGGRFLVIESESRGSHGLDRRRADELADRLRSAGFTDASVSKPARQLVVAATVP